MTASWRPPVANLWYQLSPCYSHTASHNGILSNTQSLCHYANDGSQSSRIWWGWRWQWCVVSNRNGIWASCKLRHIGCCQKRAPSSCQAIHMYASREKGRGNQAFHPQGFYNSVGRDDLIGTSFYQLLWWMLYLKGMRGRKVYMMIQE